MEVLKVFENIIRASDELAYILLSGIKKALMRIPLMVLKHLWSQEVGCHTLNDYIVVHSNLDTLFM